MRGPSGLIPVTRKPAWRAARTARRTEACVKGRARVIGAVPIGATGSLEAVMSASAGCVMAGKGFLFGQSLGAGLNPSHNGLPAVVNIDPLDPNYLVWTTA